jgi:hypothetical protein
LLIDDLLGDFQHGRIGQRQVGMADLLGLAPFLVCATSSAGSYRRADHGEGLHAGLAGRHQVTGHVPIKPVDTAETLSLQQR